MLVNQLDRVAGKSVSEAASTVGSVVISSAWAGLFCACAQAPHNARLPRALTEAEVNHERALPPNRSDELLIVLSFSGGGVRAAALAYGVLEALAGTRVPDATGTHRLLDDVTLIIAEPKISKC